MDNKVSNSHSRAADTVWGVERVSKERGETGRRKTPASAEASTISRELSHWPCWQPMLEMKKEKSGLVVA